MSVSFDPTTNKYKIYSLSGVIDMTPLEIESLSLQDKRYILEMLEYYNVLENPI